MGCISSKKSVYIDDITKYDVIYKILENMCHGVMITNKQLQPIYTNDAFTTIFGYDKTEITRDFNIKNLMTSCDALNHDKYVRRYQNTKEKRIINKTGRVINCIHKDGSNFTPLEFYTFGNLKRPLGHFIISKSNTHLQFKTLIFDERFKFPMV